jgi:hypothetical protein
LERRNLSEQKNFWREKINLAKKLFNLAKTLLLTAEIGAFLDVVKKAECHEAERKNGRIELDFAKTGVCAEIIGQM